jgi:hypothetical protein
LSQRLQCRSSGRSVQLLALHQGAGGCMHDPALSLPPPSLPPLHCPSLSLPPSHYLPLTASLSPSLPPLHCPSLTALSSLPFSPYHLVLSHRTLTCHGPTIPPDVVPTSVLVSPPRGQTRLSHRWNLPPLRSIVYGSTKGFVSYGGFTHVGFPPSHASASPRTLYPSSLQLPLSLLSLPLPSRRSRVPASAVAHCPATPPSPQIPTLPSSNLDRVVLLLDSAFWLDLPLLNPGNTPFQQQASQGMAVFNASPNVDPTCLTTYPCVLGVATMQCTWVECGVCGMGAYMDVRADV